MNRTIDFGCQPEKIQGERKPTKKKNMEYIEKTFTNSQIERILDLACRRIKENYDTRNPPNDKDDGKIWFELFYQHSLGYNDEKSWNECVK